MKYNLYRLNNEGNIESLFEDSRKSQINETLTRIENAIIYEFTKKQKGLIGISNLGDELRRNDVLNNIFEFEHEGRVFVKLTGNKMSFLKVFVKAISNFHNLEIYFFLLDRDFGKSANLVDNTFIKIDDIVKDLEVLFENFRTIKKDLSVHFIEMLQFDNHFIENTGKYAFLHSK